MKVTILEACDALTILLEKEGKELRFYFNQEDTKERLVEVFTLLGVEAVYEEDY